MNALKIMLIIAGILQAAQQNGDLVTALDGKKVSSYDDLLHLCITSAGLTMTRVLDWRHKLSALDPLTRHIIWTHGAFVLLTIIAFGVVSVSMAGQLASGALLGRAICGFVALFWGIRLMIQFFLFDARPYLAGNRRLAFCYHGLTVVFIYFVVTYTLAATLSRS